MGVVREFSKEEVVMAETRRMAEETKRFGEEVQEGAQRFGREYQKAAETGFGLQADRSPKPTRASKRWRRK